MSQAQAQDQDEARAARIAKYKEERRRELTARTAVIFSNNVTDRRQRTNASRKPEKEAPKSPAKSASELNLSAASTSVPIRTTRTSRLRAAAATHSDSSLTLKKSNRSSSVQSLEDAKKKPSRILDRDKIKAPTRRQSNEKENLKAVPTADGAIRKPKHSINKNLLDTSKTKSSLTSKNGEKPKLIDDKKRRSINVEKKADVVKTVKAQDLKTKESKKVFGETDTSLIDVEKDKVEDLFDSLVADDNQLVPNLKVNNGKNEETKTSIPNLPVAEVASKVLDSDVPNDENEEGLFGVMCVPKVQRFSELLSNLCSPREAELLFEDILVENGIEGNGDSRKSSPECAAPCRRLQPTSRPTSTPKRALLPISLNGSSDDGTAQRTRTRRLLEASFSKTESPLSSSKSPKTINLPFLQSTPLKTSSCSPSSKSNEKRRSSESNGKPSCIPLSKKTPDKQNRTSTSPVKQNLNSSTSKQELSKPEKHKGRSVRKSPEKPISDSENHRNDRRHRVKKDTDSHSEKYHYSKKRLTSLENNSQDTSDVKQISSKQINDNTKPFSHIDAKLEESNNPEMSTLHEPVIPHVGNSRLSQEMDSLAALTKQTLDRVNKLSNNLNSIKLDSSEPKYESLFATTEQKNNNHAFNLGLTNERTVRGVNERLKDIDTAAQRLIDFEKQSAMFSDLNNDTSQIRRPDTSSTSSQTPVSILKRKSIHEDSATSSTLIQAIASPPVTFSPSVVEPRNSRQDSRLRQGILKKRRSLDESQVARRSCSPEVSFADDGSSDSSKPILKNRRSSLEDVLRSQSPIDQIQGILKRKMSREEDLNNEDISQGSPEPHGILKRKSNSSSSSSTTSSHVSIAQAVLLAAAGGAELVDDDKETVRPILKKKSFSEERPSADTSNSDTPRPILKKKSIEHEDYDFERPKKPILKSSKKLSGDEGHSSFELSEDDRSSRRSSLLRSRTSDHSGSECEATVRPILKQRGSSLTRERSQSPRPRLSFCADSDANEINFSCEASDLQAAGPQRSHLASGEDHHPSAVLRRRNLRPRPNPRSKSLACDVNDELLSILNNRRLKIDCENVRDNFQRTNAETSTEATKSFPSIASRIKEMEQALTKDLSREPSTSRTRGRDTRDKERYKTQPITVDEIRSISTSLEPSQQSFQPFGATGCSFPSQPVEIGASYSYNLQESEKDPFAELEKVSNLFAVPYTKSLDENRFGGKTLDSNLFAPTNGLDRGEATFLDFETSKRRPSTLDEIEQEVNKVRVALDEDSRALDEDERQEADNWSLNVSCDSGVYNRASSRDSGPHSGEELNLLESNNIHENHASNSSSNEWSSSSLERNLRTMDRARKSTETEPRSPEDPNSDDEAKSAFALGLCKSNSVVARASMWQALQQQAKGTPKPLLRHRSKSKDLPPSVVERFKTTNSPPETPKELPLALSKSTANVLDRDEDAKLDEDDPAKMSLAEKMKMFNTKLTHKPPVASHRASKEDRMQRASRLKTMPVLASQVQEAIDQNERLTQSLTHDDVPRNPDFQLKMELFRSASAKNTSLEFLMRQNSKYRSLDYDEESPAERAAKMITPEVGGILKSGVPTRILAKGESSEGLKDEGIDSSSDDETASATSVSSSEKSCSSSDSSDEHPGPKTRRFQRKSNKLKNSRTDSDIIKANDSRKIDYKHDARKFQLPGAHELKERLTQAKNSEVKLPMLGKLGRKPSEEHKDLPTSDNRNRIVTKITEPIQLGKLRRPADKTFLNHVEEKPPTVLKISNLNQAAKNKFFGLETQNQAQSKKEKSLEEIAIDKVRKYIPPVSKSMSIHTMEPTSGSDGESSGGREVRIINNRVRHRFGGGGVQRSATHAEMPHRGGTIAERLAALQAAGANDWRARVCRLSPEKEDSKAIERVKNQINETLNAAVDEKKKVQIEDNELGSNILADRRTKLETAAQGWRKRVPEKDAVAFTVAGRLERDNVVTTPPLTPPPVTTLPPLTPSHGPVIPSSLPSTPGTPAPNKFRSRKPPSPTNGFTSGPLRSASCAVVNAQLEDKTKDKEPAKIDRECFKRSHSVSENISRVNELEESPGVEKSGVAVMVPRADDETFHAFFAPTLKEQPVSNVEVDLDAIDSNSRQMLASDWSRRAKRERKHVASRNPLRALAARTDIKQEYVAPPNNLRNQLIKEKATANCGLAAEALAALASKEDFSNVALRSASATNVPNQGTKTLMLLQVKGRRKVQTRLVEPTHTSVNRGDCFVLVTPDQVYLYIGLYCNVIERNRSTDIAQHINNTKDLGCKNSTSVSIIDEQAKNVSNKHWNQFWSLLGVKEGIEDYKPAGTGHPDEDEIYESCIVQTNMCYEVSDDELLPIKEYWGQLPKISMLHQSKTIVFDFGSELYIWYGKNVPLESRRRAAQLSQELFDDGYNYEECHINPLNAALYQGARDRASTPDKTAKSRPDWAILSKVTQHMETILFKEKFLDWPDYTRVIKIKPQENKSSSNEINPCDAEEMWSNDYQDPDLILEGSHVGRGTHYYDKESMRNFDIKTKSVCKWVIREYDFQKVENDSEIGQFFSADSYIIRWEYQITVSGRELNGKPSKHNTTGRDRCAYFCWQGKDASSNEKGAAALLTVELDREKGPQVRVAQGSEPPAFLNLFQGNLVIHQGKKDTDKNRYRLFVTRGNISNEAYLLQVPCSVRQLRSRGSLLLVDTEKGGLYIWHGARSLKHTKNIAIELANKLIARKSTYLFGKNVGNVKITEVKEGEEPKEVLEALGVANKQYYNSVLSGGRDAGGDGTPRLFHFTDLGGTFEAHEVLSPLRHQHLVTPFPFDQKELYAASQPALFLVDDGVWVWLWHGWWPRSEDGTLEPAERTTGVGAFAGRWQAMRAAALRTAEAYWRVSRKTRPDVRVVTAGLEPQTFTDLFDTWAEHDEAAEANIAHGYKAGEILSGACELSRLTSHDAVLPLAALQRRPLPDHVDPHHLERHLASPDFLEAFGMTKEDFSSLPAWKQTNLKKDVGLF